MSNSYERVRRRAQAIVREQNKQLAPFPASQVRGGSIGDVLKAMGNTAIGLTTDMGTEALGALAGFGRKRGGRRRRVRGGNGWDDFIHGLNDVVGVAGNVAEHAAPFLMGLGKRRRRRGRKAAVSSIEPPEFYPDAPAPVDAPADAPVAVITPDTVANAMDSLPADATPEETVSAVVGSGTIRGGSWSDFTNAINKIPVAGPLLGAIGLGKRRGSRAPNRHALRVKEIMARARAAGKPMSLAAASKLAKEAF